jgi:hypothetical protein
MGPRTRNEPTKRMQKILGTKVTSSLIPAETQLKVNAQYKLFQFVAPDKDFGVKYDPKMTVLKNVIGICYNDSTMRLTGLNLTFSWGKSHTLLEMFLLYMQAYVKSWNAQV